MARAAIAAIFLFFGSVCGASAQDQAETLPLAIGDHYSVTVAELEKLPVTRIATKTPFLPGAVVFEGVLLRDILRRRG